MDKRVQVVRLFHEVRNSVKHSIKKGFENMGITMPQGMVIGTLFRSGKMTIGGLSSRLGLSNSTISGIVDRLEKQRMVERTRSGEDRRVVYVRLTDEFEGMHRNFIGRADEHIEKLLSSATPEELDKIVEGLSILKNLLDGHID